MLHNAAHPTRGSLAERSAVRGDALHERPIQTSRSAKEMSSQKAPQSSSKTGDEAQGSGDKAIHDVIGNAHFF
jgi:hypothetical protein